MEIHFEPVNSENQAGVLALGVAQGQAGFIESTRQCLDEAAEYDGWRPVGIYDGKTLVGFAMYGAFHEGNEHRVWLDRYLIDARYQGRGYGKTALPLLMKRLEAAYGCEEIYLSLYAENTVAARLYSSVGFSFNGETDTHGEKVMVCRLNSNVSSGAQTRYHARAEGFVQGVGFRYFVRYTARLYGITGWVRNLDDGSVELEAQGAPETAQLFLQAVRQGGRHAQVDRMTVRETAPIEENGFIIRD